MVRAWSSEGILAIVNCAAMLVFDCAALHGLIGPSAAWIQFAFLWPIALPIMHATMYSTTATPSHGTTLFNILVMGLNSILWGRSLTWLARKCRAAWKRNSPGPVGDQRKVD